MNFVYNYMEYIYFGGLRVKFELDKQYVKISTYFLGTLAAGYIIYSLLKNSGKILTVVFGVVGELLNVLSPLIIGMVLMYLLYPAVLKIEDFLKKRINYFANPKKRKLCRNLSLVIVYLIVVLVIVGLVMTAYLMVRGDGDEGNSKDFLSMIKTISSYASSYNQVFSDFSDKLNQLGLSEQVQQQTKVILTAAKNLVNGAISGFFRSIGNIGGNIISFFLGIMISFYLISDLTYFRGFVKKVARVFSNREISDRTKMVINKMNKVVSGFIRGQLLDSLIVGILNSIGLTLIGLDFAIVIGMMAGAFNVIPYFGMYIAMIPAIIVGLLSGTPILALFAALVMIGVQQIDVLIISPRVIGGSVGIHPVFVILSIIIAGNYFGLIGMLLAVPIAAMIKVLFVEYVLENPKYNEGNGLE